MELVEQDHRNSPTNSSRRQQHGTTLTQSTAPTAATSKAATTATDSVTAATGVGTLTIPPCVVCHEENRTHIATPCMHFAFCAECARRLSTSGRGCFVCGLPNVAFAAVSV